jgi:hypothetical protein
MLSICVVTLLTTSGCLVGEERGHEHAEYRDRGHSTVVVREPVVVVRPPEVIVR